MQGGWHSGLRGVGRRLCAQDLEVPELFRRYLAVGVTLMPDGSLRHGVMPHKLRDRKRPGTVWTLSELAQAGRCIFFDAGRCSIYPHRPYECARMIHDRQEQSVQLRHHIVKAWTDAALKPFAKLTGCRLFGSSPKGSSPLPRRKQAGRLP